MANCRRESDVRCQMCSSSFCRRGVASSDAADSGRINPFGASMEDVGGVPAVGAPFALEQRESRTPDGGRLEGALLAFSG